MKQKINIKESSSFSTDLDVFKAVFENSFEYALITDIQGNIKYVNVGICIKLGYKEEELLLQNVHQIDKIYSTKSKLSELYLSIPINNIKTIKTKHIGKDNSEIPIDLSLCNIILNNENLILAFAKLVTNKKGIYNILPELSAILNQSPVIITLSDLKGNLEYVNPKFTNITQFKPEEVIGKNPELFLSEDSKSLINKKIWEKLRSGNIWEGELRNQCKDGSLYWEKATIVPIFDNNNNRIKYLKIAEEITEKKEVLQKLLDSEERFRKLSDLTFEGILIHEDGIILECNESLPNLTGYSHNELIGAYVFDKLVPLQYHSIVKSKMQQKYALPYKIKILDKNGKLFPVEIESKNLLYKGKNIRVTAVRDISFQEQVITDLEDSENKYRTMIERSNDMIWTLDREGKFTFMNNQTELIIGDKLKKWKGKSFEPFILKEEIPTMYDIFSDGLKGISRSYQVNLKLKNKIVILAVNTAPIYEKDDIIGLVSFGRDITEENQILEKYIKSEKRYKALSDLTFEAVFVTKDGYCIDANKSAEEIFGYSIKEFIGMYGTEIIAEESKETVNKFMLEGSEIPYQAIAIKKDGTKFPVELNGRMIDLEGDRIRVTSVRDITNRAKYEDLLKEQHKELEEKVINRTSELKKKNEELERFNNLFIGREFRIKELRDKVKKLEEKIERLK